MVWIVCTLYLATGNLETLASFISTKFTKAKIKCHINNETRIQMDEVKLHDVSWKSAPQC